MKHPTGAAAQTHATRGETLMASYTLAGVMRQLVTEQEMLAADLDDDLVSSIVHRLRVDVDWLGTALTQERQNEKGPQ